MLGLGATVATFSKIDEFQVQRRKIRVILFLGLGPGQKTVTEQRLRIVNKSPKSPKRSDGSEYFAAGKTPARYQEMLRRGQTTGVGEGVD